MPVDALPRQRLLALWSRLGATWGGEALYEAFALRYQEPGRAYHTATHINACLALFDEVRPLAAEPDEVEIALWFHDAIYDTHASDNEARSAHWAAEALTVADVPGARAARVADMIEATRDHHATSPDAALVIDIDLSILGADRETWDAFEKAIRQEYSWVAEGAYRAGRKHILSGFLARPALFHTPVLRDRLESNARENLRLAIEQLS